MQKNKQSLLLKTNENTFRSNLLGELFNRKNNSIGFKITQKLKDQLDIKILNKLANTKSFLELEVSSLKQFLEDLLVKLKKDTNYWYWFENEDFEANDNFTKVDVIMGANYNCISGFNMCSIIKYDYDEEINLKELSSIEVEEGTIYINKENSYSRYSSEIIRLKELIQKETSTISLKFDKLQKENKPTVKSFTRNQLKDKAESISKAVTKHLKEQLEKAHFSCGINSGNYTSWQKGSLTIEFDKLRFSSEFRVFLKVGHLKAELYPKESLSFNYNSKESLKNQLKLAYIQLEEVGFKWLENPNLHKREEWQQMKLITNESS